MPMPNIFGRRGSRAVLIDQTVYRNDSSIANDNFEITLTPDELKKGGTVKYVNITMDVTDDGTPAFYDNLVKILEFAVVGGAEATIAYTYLLQNPNITHKFEIARTTGALDSYKNVTVTVWRDSL